MMGSVTMDVSSYTQFSFVYHKQSVCIVNLPVSQCEQECVHVCIKISEETHAYISMYCYMQLTS